MDWSYFWIPFITIITAAIGFLLAQLGLDWYFTIHLPSWTPSGAVIGVIWMVNYFLSALSAWLVLHIPDKHHADRMRFIILTFVLLACLDIFQGFLFFSWRLLGLATLESAVLSLTGVLLIVLMWPLSRRAALLLVPYTAWAMIATYLLYGMWILNP